LRSLRNSTAFICTFLFLSLVSLSVQGADRLRSEIAGRSQTILPGNTQSAIAQAKAETMVGPVPMEHMVLVLRPDASQQSDLESLIAQQQDPKSPVYRKFLTPEDFGQRFGVSDNDLAKISAWLSAKGFRVEEVPPGRRSIVFSGSSDQVAAAFNTQIRRYTLGTERHIANATDPQIPAAMSPVVNGVLKLHDFRHQSSVIQAKKLGPLSTAQFNYGSNHYLSPADFATIYNANSLYSSGVNGAGQTIAIIGRSNISMDDVQAFRSQFGLPANPPKITVVNSDPGQTEDAVEALLDTEWSAR
jgi:subtilase family serine protease